LEKVYQEKCSLKTIDCGDILDAVKDTRREKAFF